jgi:hypothetical protein
LTVFLLSILEFYAFMTPDPEPEYYKGIDDHFFEDVKVKPEKTAMFGLSRFEKCKAGQLVRPTQLEISTAIK